MRNLLVLVLACILGIYLVYAEDLMTGLLVIGMLISLFYATNKTGKKNRQLVLVGLAIGVIISQNYQSTELDNNYYVNATYFKRLGITDLYLYRNRIIEVESYNESRSREKMSPLIVGSKVQMSGRFEKKRYSLAGILFKASDVEIIEDSTKSLRYHLEAWKEKLARQMKASLGMEEGSLAASLVLGVRDDLLNPRRNTLKYLGLLHILSISGFHVNLLEMILERIGLKKGKLLLITLYAVLINGVSGWRACLMRLVKVVGNRFERDCDPFNQLLLSALILLIYRPYLLFSASFQLTYLATLGLIILQRPIRELTIKLPRGKLKEGLILSGSAMIFCVPVLSTMSFDVNLALFPANLILVPLYSMFCMLSFFSLPLVVLNLKTLVSVLSFFMIWLLQFIYFFEYIISEYFSLRITWSGVLIFLWLFVFYEILRKYSSRPLSTLISLGLFYVVLFQVFYLPGTTRIIFYKQMGQAKVVMQQNLHQYEFVTGKMYKPSVKKWVIPVEESTAVGNVLFEPGVIFPKVTLEDYEISPMEDPSSDIIDEEYLLIFGKLIRLK